MTAVGHIADVHFDDRADCQLDPIERRTLSCGSWLALA
jgi:hypothetical protein